MTTAVSITASPAPAQPSRPDQPVMPAISLDTADAVELAELLQFIAGWLAADPATLSPSLLAYVGHPAYGLDARSGDLDRFAFLLGGNDGEHLLEPGQG